MYKLSKSPLIISLITARLFNNWSKTLGYGYDQWAISHILIGLSIETLRITMDKDLGNLYTHYLHFLQREFLRMQYWWSMLLTV